MCIFLGIYCTSERVAERWLTSHATTVIRTPHSSNIHVFFSCFFCGWVGYTVYPKKYAHGFIVLCFVVVMHSFIMSSHEVFIHIHQGCFAGTGAIVRLPQCQWSKPDGYGKISQCITTTKHSKAKTVCMFLGIYCSFVYYHCSVVLPGSWPLTSSLLLVSMAKSKSEYVLKITRINRVETC